ncbi:conserved hypothetical protein [Ricinus communis]|uniref:Uncharacterized protein n=1 Tax=Ricinus communis TaxID=3988 RepID=B9S7B6_RICCO|nr:conserved hypothetical protein [Ricinus communis]
MKRFHGHFVIMTTLAYYRILCKRERERERERERGNKGQSKAVGWWCVVERAKPKPAFSSQQIRNS